MEWDQIVFGDSREVLKSLPDCSVDSVVTDPPAGIAFMGREWDDPEAWKYPVTGHGFTDGGKRVPALAIGSGRNPNCRTCKRHKRGWKDIPGCECEKPEFDDQQDHLKARGIFVVWLTEIMRECLRVLKPGGHMLVWGIPRTSHWTATAIEDAGFEIRDNIHHIFGSGFPKSLSISRAITKMGGDPKDIERWDGWGTSLKPAVEHWILARKPIEAQNVASQVLATGTGALNIDGARVGYEAGGDSASNPAASSRRGSKYHVGNGIWREAGDGFEAIVHPKGRWPSNCMLSHAPGCKCVGTKSVPAPTINRFTDGMKPFGDGAGHPYESSGGGSEERAVYECEEGCPIRKLDEQGKESQSTGASRFFTNFEPEYDVPFFYTRKASKADKNKDLEDLPLRAQHKLGEQTISTQSNRKCQTCGYVKFGQPHCECEEPDWEETEGSKSGNFHPTVKSQPLMRFLVRLVTPPGGIVLDPFAGSGSTCVAAITEGFKFLGIEREADYHLIAKTRTDKALGRAQEDHAQKDAFDSIFDLPQE
jgi:site-specific DNA-methyltransferase (adenine-specific)